MVMCPPEILIIALSHSVIVLGKSVEAVKIARQVGDGMYTYTEREIVTLPQVDALLCENTQHSLHPK